MSSVTLKGKPYSIKGDIPVVGSPSLDFTFVKEDLTEASLYDDFNEGVRVLIAVPSLDTGVCQTETKHFNEELGKRDGVTGIVISKDLPFAMKRFCEVENVENIIIGSDYRYSDFINEYNTEILSGPFKGLSARAVFVISPDNNIHYAELVSEIADQPNYEKVLQAVDELI